MAFDPQNPPTRTIEDDDGLPHAYSLLPFGATEGWRLATQLFALMGGPLGRVLDGLLGGSKGGGVDLTANLDLGSAVRDLASALVASDSDKLVKALLRNTRRDGQGLDNGAIFDRAYQANYGELGAALAWAIEVNGFVRFFSRLVKGIDVAGVVSRFQPALPSSSPASQTPSA